MSPKDDMVLRAIVCHPGRSDRDLSSVLGISKSSFSIIRKKLVDSGSFKRIGIPAVWSIGWDVLTFRIIKNLRPRIVPREEPAMADRPMHDIFDYSDIDTHLAIAAYHNLAEWKLDRYRLTSKYPADLHYRTTFIDMPLKDLHIYNMFDYHGLLHCSHGCPLQISLMNGKYDAFNPSVLRSLVDIYNPVDCEKEGSGSKNGGSIARHRNRYRDEGLIVERNIPGFPMIGKGILCVHKLDLLDNSAEDLREIEKGICNMTILNLESNYEQVLMTVHDDLGSAVVDASRIMDEYHRRGLIDDYPKVYHISAEDPRPPVLPQNIRNMMNWIQ
ncbi:MAG: helix-turn-helix domain-containing protein [Candidatus Thermoplasmatota archaeon]|nr:helix-turn-helix domain-containing protein [Candidatus Thermoplasmatota archaeon]